MTATITVNNKPYDATTAASIASRSLSGVIGNDDVTLGASGTAAFANKNVGTGKLVSVTGLSLDGSAAANYALSAPTASTTANITARPITVTAVADEKVYDGTTSSVGVPTITSGSLANGDTATFTQTYNSKDVLTAHTLIPAGSVSDGNGGNNYAVTFTSIQTESITPAPADRALIAQNKVYDGTAAATIAWANLSGMISGDDVSLAGGTAAFVDKNVGQGKTVTATGVSLTGGDASNYTLNTANATADITPATLTVAAGNASRVYGAPNPTFTVSYSGFVPGEDESILSGKCQPEHHRGQQQSCQRQSLPDHGGPGHAHQPQLQPPLCRRPVDRHPGQHHGCG